MAWRAAGSLTALLWSRCMRGNVHTLSDLFKQLGLPSETLTRLLR